MRIVITGGSGMLGHRLMRRAASRHDVWGTFHTHPVKIAGCSMMPLDVTKEAEVRARLNEIQPDVVLHTAALTDVDECEKNPERARNINSHGTAITAKVTEELGAQLVYISTDYVFDGAKGGYKEDDVPNPVNHYGASKLLGEEFARQQCSRGLIVRTTIFGRKIPPQVGMVESMVSALRSGKSMTRFVDQYFTPLYTDLLSELLLCLAERQINGRYHVGSRDKVSRYEFSRQVVDVFALSRAEIRQGPFHQIDGLAQRPKDTSLNCDAITGLLGVQLPTVKEGLVHLERDWNGTAQDGVVIQ